MTNLEFSNEFDILYNNIMSNQAPGLNEYEKSVFLTKAQDEIIKNYFNPKGNKYQEGFDGSAKRQIDFSNLMTSKVLESATLSSSLATIHTGSNTQVYQLPLDVLMYVNEFLDVTRDDNTKRLVVVPLSYDEYMRLMSKPYQRPLKNQAWRLIIDKDSSAPSPTVQLIPGANDTITQYSVRYVRKPKPIILEDLEGVTLNGTSEESKCELDSSLHQEILQRAVELAKASYQGDVNTIIETGKRSE